MFWSFLLQLIKAQTETVINGSSFTTSGRWVPTIKQSTHPTRWGNWQRNRKSRKDSLSNQFIPLICFLDFFIRVSEKGYKHSRPIRSLSCDPSLTRPSRSTSRCYPHLFYPLDPAWYACRGERLFLKTKKKVKESSRAEWKIKYWLRSYEGTPAHELCQSNGRNLTHQANKNGAFPSHNGLGRIWSVT